MTILFCTNIKQWQRPQCTNRNDIFFNIQFFPFRFVYLKTYQKIQLLVDAFNIRHLVIPLAKYSSALASYIITLILYLKISNEN